MTKNLFLGAVRGGAVSAVLGALFMVILSALDTGSMMGVMAISAAVILAPFGAGLGLVAGGLAEPKWSVLKLTVLGAAIGLGGGLFLAISLVTMSSGNWVMGLLAIGAGLIWGTIVSGVVARFRTPASAAR